MAVSQRNRIGEDTVCCPTCKAVQEWSDTCRRCKCDLALLRSVAEASRESRRRCLLLLRAGRVAEALRQARRCYTLRPDEHSARLLAVCCLLGKRWAEALSIARFAGD